MSKRIRSFFCFLISLFFLNGCARTNRTQPLEVWTISLRPLFTDYMESVIKEWETSHPGTRIKWIDLPFNAVQQKLIVALASGHPPAVVNLNTDMAQQMAEMGVLENLNENLSPGLRGRYFSGFWKPYAIPWYVSTEVIMYNSEIFREAGLDPARPPATWNDLIADAKIIKDKTGMYGWFPSIKFLDELQEQGIPIISNDGKKALFDSRQSVKWLQMYVTLLREGYLPRDVILLQKGYQEAVDLYQAGKLGMLVTGPQFLNRVRDNAPSVYQETRVAPLPMGDGKVIGAAVMNLAIPKNAPYRSQGLDFALFLTNDRNQLNFCKMVPVFPSTIRAASDPFFTGSNGENLMAEARIIGARELEVSRDLTLNLKNEKDRNEAIQDGVVSALLGKKTPMQALRDAASVWDKLLQ